MRFRELAAISFYAWYLMLPPDAGEGRRLRFAPLSQWDLIETFDSQRACERMRSELIQKMLHTAMDTSRCVSSDDPNLKGSPHEPPVVGSATS